MASEIEIPTFPFTKYGVIDGTISHVSTDVTIDEQQRLIYRTSVTAEVQIGERRIIESFLMVLLEGKQETSREG